MHIPAGLRKRLNPHGYVRTVSADGSLMQDKITYIDPNSEFDLPDRRRDWSFIKGRELVLNPKSKFEGVDRTAELRENAVPCQSDDFAIEFGHFVEELVDSRFRGSMDCFLVHRHQGAIPFDVRAQNGREAAGRPHARGPR
jgi:hypothetical protein